MSTPRQAKVIVLGFPHHLVQCGYACQAVSNAIILSTTLRTSQEWKQVYELEVFSYCRMMNHVHLVGQAHGNLTVILQLMKDLAGR